MKNTGITDSHWDTLFGLLFVSVVAVYKLSVLFSLHLGMRSKVLQDALANIIEGMTKVETWRLLGRATNRQASPNFKGGQMLLYQFVG